MKQPITPEAYANLEGIDRLGWTPVYKGYKTKKQREYRECEYGTNHFIGWGTVTTPIGKPLRYTYHKPTAMEIGHYYMMEKFSKDLLERSERDLVFNKDTGDSKTITFTRNSV